MWNPKVPHCTHKRPPPVPILSQPNPVLITKSHLLKVHPNIILPSTPGSPQRSLPLEFPHQHPVHSPPFPHTGHMPRPSHSSRFYHPHKRNKIYNTAVKILIHKKFISGSDACEVSVVKDTVTARNVVFKISFLPHLVNYQCVRKSDVTSAKFRSYESVLLS